MQRNNHNNCTLAHTHTLHIAYRVVALQILEQWIGSQTNTCVFTHCFTAINALFQLNFRQAACEVGVKVTRGVGGCQVKGAA